MILFMQHAALRLFLSRKEIPSHTPTIWAWDDAEELAFVRRALELRGYTKEDLDSQPFKKYDLIFMYVHTMSLAG
jgi:hypothetical protein